MNNKIIRSILIGSVAAMGLALLLVLVQIAGYIGAPKGTLPPAAASRPAPPPPAPAAPAPPAPAPEAGAEEPAAE